MCPLFRSRSVCHTRCVCSSLLIAFQKSILFQSNSVRVTGPIRGSVKKFGKLPGRVRVSGSELQHYLVLPLIFFSDSESDVFISSFLPFFSQTILKLSSHHGFDRKEMPFSFLSEGFKNVPAIPCSSGRVKGRRR